MQEVAVLAVDAGGSWCRAALCSREGQILRYVQGGSCNYHSIGVEKATNTLTMVLAFLTNQQALRAQCVILGLAGADTKRDRAVLTALVHDALAAAKIVTDHVYLDNDAMLTLKGSSGANQGVILVAGTGSIACGIAKDGREVRVGGWGYRIGDEGSGYFIGKAALAHILRAYDGREEPSGISAAVLRELSLADEAELITWVYGSQSMVHRIAALTSVIVRLAEAGDYRALEIVQQASHELAEMALAVVRKLGLLGTSFTLFLCGGVLQNTVVHRQVVELVASKCKEVEVLLPAYQPICAGLRYGLRVVGINDQGILDGLAGQLEYPLAIPKT